MPKVRRKRYVTRASNVEQDRISYDKEHGHSIPKLLIERIGTLQNIRHRRELNGFVHQYANKTFRDPSKEGDVVVESLGSMLGTTIEKSTHKILEKMMKMDLANQEFDDEYRDHFIHPFQDFLLGCVILDNYYSDFRKWYSLKLGKKFHEDIEACWLLSTIFHDRMRGYETASEYMEDVYASEPQQLKWKGLEPTFSRCLASVHQHIEQGKDLGQWKMPRRMAKNDFIVFLANHAKMQDHGVLGAFALLNHMGMARGDFSTFTPTEAMAALAIALHNHGPQADFLACSVLPVRMETFPIPALLLYCDAAQEWGRPSRTSNPEIFLVDLMCNPNQVVCTVSFSDHDDAKNKITEFQGVHRCMKSKRPKFDCDIRIHSSS